MSDTPTPRPEDARELSDDALEAAAGGCTLDPNDGNVIGGGDVVDPGPIVIGPGPFNPTFPIDQYEI